MTEEERIVTAGEYVLGTLDPAERAAFAARVAGERASANAVRWWEGALAPLIGNLPDVSPPAEMWARIAARIGFGGPVANDREVPSAWRVAALGLGALAAVLGAFVLLRPPSAPVVVTRAATPPPRTADTFIAALNSKGQESALLLTLDPQTGVVVAHPVKLSAPAARNLELWWIADGAPPKAVGLLDPARSLRGRIAVSRAEGGVFAVSVEPLGGSTTGAPTGPVVYTGAVVRAES